MVLTTGCQDASSWSLCSATSEKPYSAGKPAKTIMLLNCQTTFPSSLLSTFSSSLRAVSPTWGFNCRSYWSDVAEVILWSIMFVCKRQAQQLACHWKALFYTSQSLKVIFLKNALFASVIGFIWFICLLQRYSEHLKLFTHFYKWNISECI